MKSGAIFGKTDKLADAERRWDLKERISIAASDERVLLEDLHVLASLIYLFKNLSNPK